MSIAAGIDIGNSTTEVVIARLASGRVSVLGAAAARTRRTKGSPESLDGAESLVRRLERQHGVTVTLASVAPLRRVETSAVVLPEPEPATGRLRLVAAGSRTVGGEGTGAGRPVRVAGPGRVTGSDPVVAVVPSGVGYRSILEPLLALALAGRLVAVVAADDEAVLIANRLGARLPVVDDVCADQVLAADRVSVEVRPAGSPLRLLSDPLHLVAEFGLTDAERPDAARLAARLRDAANAVVCVGGVAAEPLEDAPAWVEMRDPAGTCRPLAEHLALLRDERIGTARAYGVPAGSTAGSTRREVDDLFGVDLAALAEAVVARAGAPGARALALAALHADAPYVDPAPELSRRLGVPVHTAPSEAWAARQGALSTPGADPASLMVDVGAGTIDVAGRARDVVAAGAGELLTACVAALSGSTMAVAEWAKRGPAVRLESPHLLLGEDASRVLQGTPVGLESLGALAVLGPAGLLPFDRDRAPGEWRALRLRLKADVLGVNVARALRTLDERPRTVVLVGGAMGDDEGVASVSRALPSDVAVGRGNIAGSLGHRYAVAYGLLRSLG